MSEAKFTKGEWIASGCGLSVNANGYIVARAHSGSNIPYTEPAKANAHLIAAAPEMYEMLNYNRKAWLNLVELNLVKQDYEKDFYMIIDKIDELLAKARGEK